MLQGGEVESTGTTEWGKGSRHRKSEKPSIGLSCQQRLQSGVQRRRLQRIETQYTVRVDHMVGDIGPTIARSACSMDCWPLIIEFRFAVMRTEGSESIDLRYDPRSEL